MKSLRKYVNYAHALNWLPSVNKKNCLSLSCTSLFWEIYFSSVCLYYGSLRFRVLFSKMQDVTSFFLQHSVFSLIMRQLNGLLHKSVLLFQNPKAAYVVMVFTDKKSINNHTTCGKDIKPMHCRLESSHVLQPCTSPVTGATAQPPE